MTSECLSSLAVDRLLAAELGEEELRRAEAHLRECAECRARHEHAAQFQARVRVELGTLGQLRAPRSAKPWANSRGRANVAFAGALAVAAALLLFFHHGTPTVERDDRSETRTKGGGRLGFYVKRGDSVERGAAGQALRPGDAVQFTYFAATDGYLAVLSIDGAGTASIYYPSGPVARPFAAGERALDASTVLDAVVGDERWFALFCESAVVLEPIRARLERAPREPLHVEGCSVDRIDLVKEAR
jgi:hypothetical protein